MQVWDYTISQGHSFLFWDAPYLVFALCGQYSWQLLKARLQAWRKLAGKVNLGGEHLIIDGQDVDAVAFGLGHTGAGDIAAALFGIDQLIEEVDGAHQDGGVALVVVMPSVRHAYLGHAVRPSVRNVAIRTRDA